MDCKNKQFCKQNNSKCPNPYCEFSTEENADTIFDLIDLFCDLKEAIKEKNNG